MLFAKLFNDETINREISEICKRWVKIKNDIIKGIITKKLPLINKLKGEILVISNLEKSLYEKLNRIDDGIILLQQ